MTENSGTLPVLRYGPPGPGWSPWAAVIPAVTLLGAVALGVVTHQPFTALLLLPWILLGFRYAFRPPGIELDDRALTVKKFRTVRIPYDQIERIEGDVVGNLPASSRLFIRRLNGRRVSVPAVSIPLVDVARLVTERMGGVARVG
ncbi:hypothetical protein [Georgenia faecalis]|uniref:PH domain-containing protein n=1 Tax=Georgenia faecalis TaxID=2483799 RepID=A0ABV9D8A1_9MICO|nr:hypothetical protein [Georgenia faecalis]